MKTCSKCKTAKLAAEFDKNMAKKDGLQSQCKVCRKVTNHEYYLRSPEQNSARRAGYIRMVEKNQKFVYEHLTTHPCVDCGNADWRVLEFDHISDDKIADISKIVRTYGLDKLQAEIVKCEVRCRNCHAIITAERAGSWRSKYMPL